MKIIIDFNNSGLSEKDFISRNVLEELINNQLTQFDEIGDEFHIDGPTHSDAIEFFKIIFIEYDKLLVLQHFGGVFII